MSKRRTATIACVLASALSKPAHAEATNYAIELDASEFYTRMTTAKDDRATKVDDAIGGGGAALSLALRSPHVVTAFVDVSYMPAYRSLRLVDLGAAAGGEGDREFCHHAPLAAAAARIWAYS